MLCHGEYINIFMAPAAIDREHLEMYRECESIFGDRLDLLGSQNVTMAYDQNEFSILSLTSLRGVIRTAPDLNALSKSGGRRYNLFKKGRIWSDNRLNYGKNFYLFLNMLTEVFGANPISTLAHFRSLGRAKPSHIVVTQDAERLVQDPDAKVIRFPSEKDFLASNSDELTEAIGIFRNHLQDNFLSLREGVDDKLDQAKARLGELLHEIRSTLHESDLTLNLIEQFKEVFDLSSNVHLTDPNKKRICASGLVYQYNHLPFELHLFYPPYEGPEKPGLLANTLLMIAKSPGHDIPKSEIQLCQDLVSRADQLPASEKAIAGSAQKLIESQLKWEAEYNRRRFAYETFSRSVENICRALCNESNCSATITSRVKVFPSFFNKLCSRANEKGVKLPCNETYGHALDHPDSYFREVFEKAIRDIAGVRVICVYESDAEKLFKAFMKLKESDKDLTVSATREYRQNRVDCSDKDYDENEFNYRGFHLTVKPGLNRLQMCEFSHLENVQCEIQIRTILAHGWSDVQHPLQYKNSVPLEDLDEKAYKEVDLKLGQISKILKDQDDEIVKLRDRIDKISMPMD